MNKFDRSNMRTLGAEQAQRLLDVHLRISPSQPTPQLQRSLTTAISEILGVKVALVGGRHGAWLALAESHTDPALPPPGDVWWTAADGLGTSRTVDVACMRHGDVDWTLIGLTKRSHLPVMLLLCGNWMLSTQTLVQLAQNILSAERVVTLSAHPNVALAAHRLSRTLARVSTLPTVCQAVLRSMTRAVPSRFAAFAVPGGEDARLSIIATQGYPLALVEHLRIDPGVGVIGSVYQNRTPLRVADVRALPGLRRRSRYRTNSFVALPVTGGSESFGVVCVTDRVDDEVFTRDDVSTLRALAAPAALALARERIRIEGQSYAQAAVIDPVSGLFNRRYFQTRLDEELQRARRQQMPIGLVMLDIDDFKVINDRFGHLAGDTVINDVADILRRSVRVFDVCTRFGGEEFAILMPGTEPEGAARIAERIRQRIEQYRSSDRDLEELRVTASVGLAMASANASARELIQRADQGLYLAKRAGKNQVRTSPEERRSLPAASPPGADDTTVP